MSKWKRPSFLRRRQPEIRLLDEESPPVPAKRRRFWHRFRPRWPRILRLRRLRRWLGRLFVFLRRINPLRSLWFKLVGAFVAVLLIMLFGVLSVINEVTSRAFSQYISARNSYIAAVIPTLVPEPPEMSERVLGGDGIELPAPPAATTVEGYPEPMPEAATAPDLIVGEEPGLTGEFQYRPDGAVIIGQDGRVFVDPDILQPVLSYLQADTGSDRSVAFLHEVRQGAQRVIFLAGIAAVFLGTILFWQITRPLSRIRTASQALAAGDLGARVPVKSRDELGKVGTAFNLMASEIEKQDRLRQQMVADVAHELRTPVTVMQSNLEAMLDGILEPNEAELQELHDEVRRLSRMIADLRLLSLADAGQLSLRQEPLPVAELVQEVAARMQPLAQAQQVELEADVDGVRLTVHGDGDRLQQALGNLIDNSIRYTPHGGKVRITAVREGDLAHISVADTGPGIPTADLPTIFERFWRGDRSRSRHNGGSGLGLSIVQQIAALHGGTVRVVSPPGAGAIFTISLPLHDK